MRASGRHLALGLAVALAAACGGSQRDRGGGAGAPAPDAGPPPVDRAAMAEIADGLLEVLRAMAEVVEARDGDCPAMAADLRAVFQHAETIVAAMHTADADPAAHAVLLEELDARAAASAGLADRIGRGLEPCREDPAVREAMQGMPVI